MMLSRISPQRLALVSLVLFLLTGAFTLVVFGRIESLIGQGGQQYTIFRLGNTLRQTSEDLTSMARLHVTTGEARYREYFEEILAIRNGEAPWPRQYANQPYWDIVLATGERPGEFGEPRSIEYF
ncbi:MAG: hypothetical protein OXB89_11700, partial [Anaerolineaceae bacterium]|nr:hypothetical protein [Anaerolineaceae bacterium]